MEKNGGISRTFRRALLIGEAALFALVAALRLLGVFSFRMAALAGLLLALAALYGAFALACYDRAHRGEAAYRVRRATALWLLLVAVVASVPLLTNYLFNGHDIQFHLFRIEGVRDGLASGQFPVRIHPNTLYGAGYANPEFYPELLLYFPAALRLCGFSVMAAYKTFLFSLNLLTAVIAYFACARMFVSRRAGLVGAALYTLSLYRLVNLYTRAAIGELSAITFLPLVALGLYTILSAEPDSAPFRRAFLWLAIGMTGLLATHLLSCEMALPLLVLVALVCVKRTLQKKRLLAILLAAGCTALLSLAFIVPMLDFMGYDEYRVFTYSVTNRAHEAVNVAQLFPLFPNAVGESLAASEGAAGEMPLGIGFPFALVLLGYPVLRARARRSGADARSDRSRMGLICYVLGALLLLMSTNLFPWTAVYDLGGAAASLASLLQFPWRLISIATLLLTLVGCDCLAMAKEAGFARVCRAGAAALLACALVTAAAYTDNLLQTGEALFIHANTDLDQSRSVGDAEYLPSGAGDFAVYRTSEPTVVGDGLTITDFSRTGASARFHAENAAEEPRALDVPLIGYLGYAARDGAGNALSTAKGAHALLRVELPAGFSGDVTVRFIERPLWRAAEAVTLIAALALALWYARQRRKNGALPPLDDDAPRWLVS